jgi:hypothetical protein
MDFAATFSPIICLIPIEAVPLFFESNLSANNLVKLCYTVLEGMGIGREMLKIEAEG